MINNFKKITALALAISGAGAFVSNNNIFIMEAEASSISGIDSLKVCEKGSSDSITLYKDASYETSTKYKSSISKYYAKLDKDVDSFNIDVSTENNYTVKIECDDDDYESGDKIDIAKGESLTVKIKVYDDDDHLEGSISITVERLNKDSKKEEEEESSKSSTNSSSTSSTTKSGTTAKTVDGKIMATGIDISNSSFYGGNDYTGAKTEVNNERYRNQWVQRGLCWIYYDKNGNVMRNKWLQSGSKWYYLQSNGYMTTGWRFIGKDWYYFDKSGAMVTGWMKDTNAKWYYFYPDGRMAANTTIDGYKLNARGAYIS